ncbi:hypothetical protein [Metabacillus litoralis]|uniref:hypothetical protein n=1 Tax=Metabacillus litoralis TaxID=152268 RepID=UPI000EF62B28|nr:hypothetical protein [Metabacillus litoralis]
MNAVQEVFKLTQELVDLFDNKNKRDRDSVIEEIEKLLHERDRLFPMIKPPFTQEEKALGEQIKKLNEKINLEFQNIKKEIQFDIKRAKESKHTQNQYVNQYTSTENGGIFYDKRK